MKVLMINSVCGIRSTGRICTDIALELERQGHKVKIAFGREVVPEQFRRFAVRIGNERDVRINALACRLFDNDGFAAKKTTTDFLKWVNNYNPDLLWIHNLHGYYINVELLFKWIKTKKNLVVKWTFHDSWPLTGHCTSFDYLKCEKWKTGCRKCPMKKEYPKSFFLDRSKKNYYRKKQLFSNIQNLEIITPSRWLSELVKKSYFGEYPVKVVNNQINESVFQPCEDTFRIKQDLVGKKIVLGVATAWGTKKGLDDFIALSEVLRPDYKVVIVGLTEKQISKIPKSIIGIERTNSIAELVEIYSAADVFVNLTYEDNYPTVNIEAQCCGTPVITYNTGGSAENVNIEHGSIVGQGDLDGVIREIYRITSIPKSGFSIEIPYENTVWCV